MEIRTADEFDRISPSSDLLRECAVVLRNQVFSAESSLDAVKEAFPWMEVWHDHPSYVTGVWTCTVSSDDPEPMYTAYKPRLLDFHNDMTRYSRPPEFTVIRCVRPAARGGENHVIHVDDIVPALLQRGAQHIVDTLARRRLINSDERHLNTSAARESGDAGAVPLLVAGQPRTPTRIYDHNSATKAQHLQMEGPEVEEYAEFQRLLREEICPDLAATVRLEAGDVLAFSNWRMLHARAACHDSGRVTEIIMGDEVA